MRVAPDVEEAIALATRALEGGDAGLFQHYGELCVAAKIPPARLVQLAIKARQSGFSDSGGAVLRLYAERNISVPESVYFELAFQERAIWQSSAGGRSFSYRVTRAWSRLQDRAQLRPYAVRRRCAG